MCVSSYNCKRDQERGRGSLERGIMRGSKKEERLWGVCGIKEKASKEGGWKGGDRGDGKGVGGRPIKL